MSSPEPVALAAGGELKAPAAIADLISAARSINRSDKLHRVPASVTGDDEPCYWQRKEWVQWLLSLADDAEANLAALLSGLVWQPIETAPAGVDLWLFCPDDDPQQIVGYLSPDTGHGAFWAPRDSLVADVVGQIRPTHWMHLRAAPLLKESLKQ